MNFSINKQENALAEFGQLPSPKAGSQLKKIEINDEEHYGYFDRIKVRYAWFPLHDVSFLGKMIMQPMSFTILYRGRTAWIQPMAYKAVDHSREALDQQGDDDLPLKTFALTPLAQAIYLYDSYAEKGMRIFEHLKGEEPELVALIEEIVLPDVPEDLIALGKYLSEQSPKNIEVADLDPRTKKLAMETLASMLAGTNDAIAYCRNLIDTSEGEILTRQNKGVGKAHLDENDRYAYKMTQRAVPTENRLDNSPERKTNELLERLVSAMESKSNGGSAVVIAESSVNEVADLKAELAEMRRQFSELLTLHKSAPGAPNVEDTTPVAPEVVQEDLQKRLERTGSKPNKQK